MSTCGKRRHLGKYKDAETFILKLVHERLPAAIGEILGNALIEEDPGKAVEYLQTARLLWKAFLRLAHMLGIDVLLEK